MDPVSILERENLNSTSQEAAQDDKTSPGWAQAGAGLGDILSGNSTAPGNPAYTKGLQVGAQTMDALAQARQRINDQQQAHQAAMTMRNPQVQQTLGIKPEEAELAAVYAEKGVPPEQITGMLQGFQKMRLGNALADPNGDPAMRHGAAFALDPASAAPKAEGPLGSTFDPLQRGGSGATTVGGPQMAFTNSEIQKNQAEGQAALQNANTNTRKVDEAPTKLATGMRWKMDPANPGSVMLDPNGQPIQEPNPTAGGGREGAINARYNQNMLGAASGMARELQNVAAIGPTTSAGLTGFGGAHAGGGLIGTFSDNLGRALSTEDQQEFHKSMQNMGRYVGILENGGRATTQGAAGSAQNAIESQPADTVNSRLYGLAIARQVMEAQQDRIHASGTSPEVIAAYDKQVEAAKKAIPYTPTDILGFGRAPKGTKLADWLKTNGQDAQAAAPAAGGGGSALPPGLKVVN
jgi:hypothetical protein